MNSALRWKLILAFVLVFLAGLICGFFAFPHLALRPHAFHRGDIAGHLRQHLAHELHLTPAQREQTGPATDRAASQLQITRQQTTEKVRAIFAEMHHAIVPFLTPEQREKLRHLEERHSAMLRRDHERIPPEQPPP